MPKPKEQLLHVVVGGEVTSVGSFVFTDLTQLDFVGLYPNYAEAHKAWRSKAQFTVDNALMRYFIIHAHRLIDPDQDADRPAQSQA
jgi:hypothetical protein